MPQFFGNAFVQRHSARGIVAKNSAPTVPQLCPLSKKNGNSFCVYAHGRLRRRKRLFGLTQTVARRLRSPYYNGSCTVFGRGEYTIRPYRNEAKKLSEWNKGAIRTKQRSHLNPLQTFVQITIFNRQTTMF